MPILKTHKKKSKRKPAAAVKAPKHVRITVFNRPDPAAPGHLLTYVAKKSGEAAVDGRSIEVDADDTVRWRSPDGNVTILFKNQSCLDDVSFHAPANNDSAAGTVLPQPAVPPRPRFAYFVALAVSGAAPGAPPVTDDPDMVVT